MQDKLCENATNRKNKDSNILAYKNISASGKLKFYRKNSFGKKFNHTLSLFEDERYESTKCFDFFMDYDIVLDTNPHFSRA